MTSSNVAKFLINQYLRSWGPDERNSSSSSSSSSSILTRFKAIAEKLEDNRTALANTESISWLYDLNDILCDWQLVKDQKKLRLFSYHRDDVTQFNKRTPVLEFFPTGQQLRRINNVLGQLQGSFQKLLEDPPRIQPNLLNLDRYTFYKPNPIYGVSYDEPGEVLLDWLLATPPVDFKVARIYGTGGSGKTALVQSVLKQRHVVYYFEPIIWACLSSQSMVETEDVRIMEYLLYRLGLDTDCLVGQAHEDRDWLLEEVERRLKSSGNYYILVFDGMWHCSKWFTDDFLGRLNENGGGVVIVTSRRKTVAERICSKSNNNMLIHRNCLF